jgi:hypothetical protein
VQRAVADTRFNQRQHVVVSADFHAFATTLAQHHFHRPADRHLLKASGDAGFRLDIAGANSAWAEEARQPRRVFSRSDSLGAGGQKEYDTEANNDWEKERRDRLIHGGTFGQIPESLFCTAAFDSALSMRRGADWADSLHSSNALYNGGSADNPGPTATRRHCIRGGGRIAAFAFTMPHLPPYLHEDRPCGGGYW